MILDLGKLKLSTSDLDVSEVDLVLLIGTSLELSSPMKLIIQKYFGQVSLLIVLKLRFVEIDDANTCDWGHDVLDVDDSCRKRDYPGLPRNIRKEF